MGSVQGCYSIPDESELLQVCNLQECKACAVATAALTELCRRGAKSGLLA